MSSYIITQPNLLPWIGYFYQLNLADTIVLLDDVQFTRRDWRNRNYFCNSGGRFLVNLPVIKSSRDTLISDILIAEPSKNISHLCKQIKYCYSTYSYYHELTQIISFLEQSSLIGDILLSDFLADLTQIILKLLLSSPNPPQLLRSSKLSIDRSFSKTQHLLQILNIFNDPNCIYLSAPASRSYLDVELLADQGIDCQFFDYPESLSSLSSAGTAGPLSIIDSIARYGTKLCSDKIK